jgi:GDP-4-dehydro-6-deoxy-D-mannose reductase
LVTGASGFVGPHLVAQLQRDGDDVRTTDRHGAGPRHVCTDLLDADSTAALVEATQPERIFHLAGLSSVAESFAHPQETLQTNLIGTCNLLEAVRRLAPRARVLIVGSAEAYGNVPVERQPIAELEPLRPASPYAVSKAAVELLSQAYAAVHEVDAVLVRAFPHSGPGQSDRFALPSFARQIAHAERGLQPPVLRVGNLDVWRDLTDVRDVVRAYAALAHDGERGVVYNVCRGGVQRIGDLVQALVDSARVPIRVEVDPARWRPADLPLLHGDPARLRTRTGWSAEIGIERTLADILADWRRRVDS